MSTAYFHDRPLPSLPRENPCVQSTYRMVIPSSWLKIGLRIAIITGGTTEAVRKRYAGLGVEDIYMGCAVKVTTYKDFLTRYGLQDEEVIYVGDDIPDYEIMRLCGCPCCPADACPDIKGISAYVSSRKGGEGVGRDIIEQVLRAQNKWLADAKAFGW